MISKLKHRYKDMQIRKKLLIMFITVIVILMVLILVVSNTILYNSSIVKTKQNINNESNLISNHLKMMHENLITCANIGAKDINRIYQGTEIEKISEISFVSIKSDIFTALDYDKICFPDISSIIFIDVNNNIVWNGFREHPDLKKVSEELLSHIEKSGPPNCVVFPIQPRPYFEDGSNEAVLTIGKRIISMQSGENIGYILINVKENTVSSIFPNEIGENYYVIDEEGKVVSSLNKEKLQQTVQPENLRQKLLNDQNDSFQVNVDNNSYLITAQRIPELNWTLVSQISIRNLTKDIQVTSSLITIIGLICIILAIILIFILSDRITKPIEKLTKAAQKLQTGDFTVKCDVMSKDEVGTLSQVFNEMIEKISDLLERVRSEQKKKREYELAMIQEQIKPHFLYNTLDLIYVLCSTGNASEGAKTTKALADYYRTSLSNGNEIITIKEELKNIENYLYIQKERYSDIIDFKLEVDSGIYCCSILKMTLQPLVENAIYHGLKEKDDKGYIIVSGQMEEDFVRLEVLDNGVGMDENQFQTLLQEESQNSRRHFGLRSVHERLQLYFGENYGITVQSKKNEGTKVTIRIPKRMGYIHV